MDLPLYQFFKYIFRLKSLKSAKLSAVDVRKSSALISNDPTDAMNPIFQDILDQYVNIMNMSEEQLTIHAAEMNLHNNAAL